jgi:hypothetical protein
MRGTKKKSFLFPFLSFLESSSIDSPIESRCSADMTMGGQFIYFLLLFITPNTSALKVWLYYYSIALYSIALHCIALYCIVLHCIDSKKGLLD